MEEYKNQTQDKPKINEQSEDAIIRLKAEYFEKGLAAKQYKPKIYKSYAEEIEDKLYPIEELRQAFSDGLDIMYKAIKEVNKKQDKPLLQWVKCSDKLPDSYPFTIIRTIKDKDTVPHDWYFKSLDYNTLKPSDYEWLEEVKLKIESL